MAKPIVVPDSLRLDPLLALLREDGFQMAVVLDEYGGARRHRHARGRRRGDRRRHRRRARPARRAGARQRRDGTWSLSGLLRPDEVEDLTGIELPDHEDYDTIAGLVLRVLGRIPEHRRRRRGPGARPQRPRRRTAEQLAVLTVIHMDGLRIDRVALRLLDRRGW